MNSDKYEDLLRDILKALPDSELGLMIEIAFNSGTVVNRVTVKQHLIAISTGTSSQMRYKYEISNRLDAIRFIERLKELED